MFYVLIKLLIAKEEVSLLCPRVPPLALLFTEKRMPTMFVELESGVADDEFVSEGPI